MKCPKCQHEVEPGSLYCRHCLAEIPWVKEFNSVETLMEKKKKEEPPQPPPSRKPRMPSFSRYKKKIRSLQRMSKRKKAAALLVLIVGLILASVISYQMDHTFQALYRKAEKAFEEERYEDAVSSVTLALEKKGDDLNANLLLGKLLEVKDDEESAIMIYEGMIREYPGSVSAYQELLGLLVETGRLREVKKVMDACEDEAVRAEMADYICEEPEFSLEEGTYTSRQRLELQADYDRIYYTLDGSAPSRDSLLYKGPIPLYEGTTVVSVLGVNALNIESDVVSREFVVVSGKPDAPVISPESGDFEKKTWIEVEVPDGCRVYYAFDEIPTEKSTEYTVPISMPAGYHVFNAIAVSANGEVSDAGTRMYYLQY